MVTRYADLLQAAYDNLGVARARCAHPATRPAPEQAPYLADLAGALAHLGVTLGDTGHPAKELRRALAAMANTDLDLTEHGHAEPRGIALDLAEATTAIRVAADLIASHGPLAEQMTPRDLAGEWAHPRPAHLTSVAARQGAWSQIADLAHLATTLVDDLDAPPLLLDAADRVTLTARRVPRQIPDPALQTTAPAWPLPLPRRGVPDEWAGRLEEVTALAWRLTMPPASGRAHPITALRLIAETGHLLHTQAVHAAADPADRDALHLRARLWRDIHRQLHALHTPTEPLMPAQEFALKRTRALAAGPLNPNDLRAGITTWTLAAGWAQTTLTHYLDSPMVGLGPTLTPELRAHLTSYQRTADDRASHPHEVVLLASLNHRTASPLPRDALAPVTALYRAAAQPVTTPPQRRATPPHHPTATGATVLAINRPRVPQPQGPRR